MMAIEITQNEKISRGLENGRGEGKRDHKHQGKKARKSYLVRC